MRTAKKWHAGYNPMECADSYGRACRYCQVLGKELDTRRGNVFYDVKETRIIKGDWLFPDKVRLSRSPVSTSFSNERTR